jgi:plastocyanin
MRALMAAAAALLVLPAAARAETEFVTMQQSAFAPAQISALVGDTVYWRNGSLRDHTILAADGSFGALGHVVPGGAYSASFNNPGAFAYYCAIHPGMTGEVDVYPLLLQAPPRPVGAGEPVSFSGRAPAGSGTVRIERDSGSGFVPVGSGSVDATGAFRATVAASTTSIYRAVNAAGGASPPVQVVVVDRKLTLRAGRHGVGRVRVTPADPGARVVLQVWLRERFGWFTVAQRKLDRHSRAEFVSRYRGRRARALLVLPDGYTPVTASAPVRLAH